MEARRALVYLMIALMLVTLQHRMRELNAPYADGPYDTKRIGEQRSSSPFQRRIAIPLLAVQIERVTGIALTTIEFGFRFIGLTATLALMDRLTALVGLAQLSLSGALLLAGLVPLGFYVNPVIDSYPAMVVLLLGMIAMACGRIGWLVPIIIVGTFIRESTVLIPAVFAVTFSRQLGPVRFIMALVAQLCGYAGVRLILAWFYPGPMFGRTFIFNLEHLSGEGLFPGVIRVATIGLPPIVALIGLTSLRGQARAMGLIGLIYCVGLFLVGRVNEPRIFYEAYPLMVPAMLAFATRVEQSEPTKS